MGVQQNSSKSQDELLQISRISETVNDRVSEVSAGLEQVASAMNRITELSHDIDHTSGKLDELVGEFKISESIEPV